MIRFNADDLRAKMVDPAHETHHPPPASMTDSGQLFHLTEPDALLLFAGDTPTSPAYGVHRVKIPAGSYKIFSGTYSGQVSP
jgi:hypothetical protein